jgi:plasmid stabilization system protein ParE
MRYAFHPEAEAELNAAIDYYEDISPGLGYDFAVEVYSTIEKILSFPEAWPELEDEIRRCQTRRFPYGVLYVYSENVILIVAVMHLHRDPAYWKDRVHRDQP